MHVQYGEQHRVIHRPCFVNRGLPFSGGASVMVWDVCGWRDGTPDTSRDDSDRYLPKHPVDHLHSFMSIVHSDGLEQFQKDNATYASRVAASVSRNTFLTLHFFPDAVGTPLNPQR
ncbi:hypothetical protein AVEN_224102-1 [Araneus ventricosus]|uniref:Uncharacterized protein n=1 Tax=Araneus ventricosus TaxID=182803 RepID=A0A4Y2DVE0_ARAVE|nr:hypothetical protein AVEN_224102-1 [Araneus ventricosus]